MSNIHVSEETGNALPVNLMVHIPLNQNEPFEDYNEI